MNTTLSNGKAKTTRTTFARETSVSVEISASREIIWALLTNAADFPRWNSTIIELTGEIQPGGKLKLRSKLDPKRVFNLRVKSFEPGVVLSWGDAMGTRTFTLNAIGQNRCHFTMHEKIGGPLFPLFAGMIPSFDASFDQFALDLKNEAEKISTI
jgi:uncharacterized protein YndB with AHSA1/START domain